MRLKKEKVIGIAAFAVIAAVLVTGALGIETAYDSILYDLYVSEGYELTPLSADGSAVDESEDGFYGAEKLLLAFDGVPGEQYTVFLLLGEKAELTEGTLRYAYQLIGEEKMQITVYPDDISAEGLYQLVLSHGGQRETVASFSVRLNILEGDVDLDGQVSVKDVILALRALLNKETEKVPDMDHDEKATLIDVVRMLRQCVEE